MTITKSRFYYKDGTISNEYILYYNESKLHRTDGPAMEFGDGERQWYINGKRHRVDGPAIEYPDGVKGWYIDGKLHRVDGPAIEYSDGRKRWYIGGEEYTEKQFNELIKQVNEMSLAMKLTDPRWWVRELGEKEVG